ncbi:MAG: MTH938/NDUFAF3 family protein [Promethearchaeia archaeon]
MNKEFIQNYGFGSIIIDNKKYTDDLILLKRKIIPHWWRDKGHHLQKSDLDKVLSFEPDVLIIGKGYYGRMKVPNNLVETLEFEVISAKTKKATKIYNQKLQKNKKIAGAFHLTC